MACSRGICNYTGANVASLLVRCVDLSNAIVRGDGNGPSDKSAREIAAIGNLRRPGKTRVFGLLVCPSSENELLMPTRTNELAVVAGQKILGHMAETHSPNQWRRKAVWRIACRGSAPDRTRLSEIGAVVQDFGSASSTSRSPRVNMNDSILRPTVWVAARGNLFAA
jgi:hypothetical protein